MNKVFIVDDEELIVTSLKATVNWEEFGFEVIGEAYDGTQAYECIINEKPQVVFTDIRMPGMSGLELIKKVNEKYPNILFVVISGYAEFAYVQKALNCGAIGYCLKPFDDQEIKSIMKKAEEIIAKAREALEDRFLTLIDNNDQLGIQRKREIINSLGIELNENMGYVVVISKGPERIAIKDRRRFFNLNFGRGKHAYVISSDYYIEIKVWLSQLEIKGVAACGASRVYNNLSTIDKAVDEACIAVNQCFMTGNSGLYEYVESESDILKNHLLKLEDAIVNKDISDIQAEFEEIKKLATNGKYNIKHAFQIYNIGMYSSYMRHSEKYDNNIMNYDQLTISFANINEMLCYIFGLIEQQVGLLVDNTNIEAKNETYRNIIAYVNEHYCEEISLQFIAQKFIINPSYVSQLFKKGTGTTFTEYITNLRVAHAVKILRTTTIPISEVAEKSGFNDYFYFTKVFKKMKGKTPSLYREGN